MEIIGLIFILWLIGCAFPGSPSGGQFEWMLIPVVIICIVLIYCVLAAITYAAFGVAWLTGVPLAGIVAWPVIFVGLMFGNKLLFDWIDRRKARDETRA